MGYLNEFPHFESNKLNLDWLLEQYSTFNDRLQEITDAFNAAVNQFESDLEDYETSINDAVASFENTVNGIISDFKTETNGEIATFEATVEREIQQLTTNMVTYVEEHMDEWQAEATYTDAQKRINFNTSNNPLLDMNKSVYGFLIGSTIHETKLSPPLYFVNEVRPTITNDYIDDCNITLTPGTFLVMAHVDGVETTLSGGNQSISLTPNDSDVKEIIKGTDACYVMEGENIPFSLTAIGIYTNINTTTNKEVKIKVGGVNRTIDGVQACAYKISDIWNPLA